MKRKDSSEFRQFDRVMDGLLAVPYAELQKKMADEKRAKKEKRSTSTASRASSDSKKRAA